MSHVKRLAAFFSGWAHTHIISHELPQLWAEVMGSSPSPNHVMSNADGNQHATAYRTTNKKHHAGCINYMQNWFSMMNAVP